eukprot:TRINITY_DN1172_c0_g1_i1.p1 TRINITY_DN1172_c0_g1~~TRINITY_DN1172_c0_g1_i1.p1  ORF type:complete len:843 (+),score=145.25 TRINITY_DN1172_c0_g1_i1:84-2612(+)
MASSTIPIHLELKLLRPQRFTATHKTIFRSSRPNSTVLKPKHPPSLLPIRATGDSNPFLSTTPSVNSEKPEDVGALNRSPISPGDGYVGLFVRMLGLDNDPLDREQAIIALWKYSLGGKHCIDGIMQYPGCINLTVNLLKSDSDSTCEAAAGLLRTISSVNVYKNSIAESGAIEELINLLSRSLLTAEVKEQSLCTLWNLSVEEKFRVKIANVDLLPKLIKFLDDEAINVKEAAGGVLEILALSKSNHSIMVEAGVIPKMAQLLKYNYEGSKVTRKEAKNVLLELAKDDYYRILIIEEGLVLVPLIGVEAYKSFRPVSYSWPSLPDGTELERSSSSRNSRYGASELLLGLNIHDKSVDLDEAKRNAIVGRTQQQFLARIGAIELEEGRKPQFGSSSNQRHTLLPWIDGVARLVLILELEDVSAISRAAQAIADTSISEHLRVSFKEAGAVKHLVRLLHHDNEDVRLATACALGRLSISFTLCQAIEAEGGVDPLVNILRNSNTSQSLLEKTVSILAQIFDPGKDMKTKFHDGLVEESENMPIATSRTSTGITELSQNPNEISDPKEMAREVLDSVAISRLIAIMKTSFPNLQQKAVCILECLANIEQKMASITACDIESGLDAVFQQRFLDDTKENIDDLPEPSAVEAEEAGLAISAGSRLLTKLLNFEQFRRTINSTHFILLLRKVLKSDIPLHTKDWVAACLVKLESLTGQHLDFDNRINMEVTLYETIPRLVEQIRTSFSPDAQEAAVIELNGIISKGAAEFTRAVAAEGGIFPIVKLIEESSGNALDASLAILYNLSMDSENHSAIVAAGAIPILKRIVLAEGPQWMRALHLLRSLPT